VLKIITEKPDIIETNGSKLYFL